MVVIVVVITEVVLLPELEEVLVLRVVLPPLFLTHNRPEHGISEVFSAICLFLIVVSNRLGHAVEVLSFTWAVASFNSALVVNE